MKYNRLSIIVIFLFVCILGINASDMKRIVLKGNDSFSGKKNILKQEMFTELVNGHRITSTNTIFVIQSDFELEANITLPSGAVLKFDGGSLKNGTINTNGCYIDAGLYQVFDGIVFNNINTYDGQIKTIDNIYIKVLAGNSFVNKKTNSIIAANSIVNRRYVYRITGKSNSPKTEGSTVTITFNGQKYTIADYTSDNKYNLKYDYSRVIGIINSTGEMASGTVNSLKGITFYFITPLSYNFNSIVKNKEIHPEWFGAKGDNKNDDSYAFNTALDLAYYSDSKVVIGNGVYKIDDALVIHTHTNLEGVAPAVEYPVKGCFSVNTDVAMLIFDQYNPTGSYILNNIGFVPFSNKYKSNYTGIKVYHSQNHARISNVGFYYPKTGIDIDAIGGVQLLRCEDISLWGEENKGVVAINTKYRLGGWFNSNYIRPAFVAHSTVVKCKGGGDNTLDGGSCETNSYKDFLIDLDEKATLIVRGGLYKETGKIAKLRNSSKLIFEGDSYLYGNIDCDETSYVGYPSRNIQSRQSIINNSAVSNDIVIAHYKIFTKRPTLWYESIHNRIVTPVELSNDYTPIGYNGRLFAKGYCKIPIGNVNIKGKTIVLRIISPSAYTSSKRDYPFTINADIRGQSMAFSQARWLENTSLLYAPGDINLGAIERGERYVFLPSRQDNYEFINFTTIGKNSFLISDIFIINLDSKDIKGEVELRLIDILNGINTSSQEGDLLNGYNKGASYERPTFLTKNDAGFEFYDTTLHKQLYWTGDTSIGDKGWVDALGRNPNQN